MARPSFTDKYRLYGEWKKAQNPNSSYFKKFEALHKVFPDKSLKQLRELSKNYLAPSKIPAIELTLNQSEKRKQAIHIIRKMQPSKKSNGMSLREAVKDYNLNNLHNKKITEREVLEAMGKYIRKGKKGRYEFNPKEKLELRHGIYSDGEYKVITISKESEREIVKEYQRDLQKALNGNPDMPGKKFKEKWTGRTVKDNKGKTVELEGDLAKIKEDMDRKGDNYVITLSG